MHDFVVGFFVSVATFGLGIILGSWWETKLWKRHKPADKRRWVETPTLWSQADVLTAAKMNIRLEKSQEFLAGAELLGVLATNKATAPIMQQMVRSVIDDAQKR